MSLVGKKELKSHCKLGFSKANSAAATAELRNQAPNTQFVLKGLARSISAFLGLMNSANF